MKEYVIKIKNKGVTTILNADGNSTLYEILVKNNVLLNSPCSGRGICGKCRVKLLSKSKYITTDNSGFFLACKIVPREDIEIEIPSVESQIVTTRLNDIDYADLAVDIGTTTVELALLDQKGKVVASVKELNGQRAFGADVESRIEACKTHGTNKLADIIRSQIERSISLFKNKLGVRSINRVVISANTIMTHILLGVSPEGMGAFPYTPSFLELRRVKGEDISISAQEVITLPCVSAFIGSDVLTGANSVGFFKSTDPSIYLDLGTNGEILLFDGQNYFATSTAVGPCFEGANISCGVGGISGAICSVCESNGKIVTKTVDEKAPIGICGAGLLSCISYLKNSARITKSGRFIDGDCFYLSDNIYLTQKDVYAFMLAKSAIRSGVTCLLGRANISDQRIKRVYLAGGLGKYADVYSIIDTGVLPRSMRDKCVKVSDSALNGAIGYIQGETELVNSDKITYVNLAEDDNFERLFRSNINFE